MSGSDDNPSSSATPPDRRSPPESTRFQKGQSGNPKGRPKGASGRAKGGSGTGSTLGTGSAFDVILDRTLAVTQGGRERALGMDEALQLRTYQDALAGSRIAQRAVLKMIASREKALAAKPGRGARATIEMRIEPVDPANADAALLLLGIASVDDRHPALNEPTPRLRLEPWAVQRALSRRRGGAALSERDRAEVTRSTRAAETLQWPRRTDP